MKTKTSELCVMIFFMMISCFLGIGAASCLNIADVDFWMIPIFGTILGFPILLIYLYLFNAKREYNINKLNEKLFGKIFGKIINILILLFVVSFSLITFWNLTSFVSSQYLYNTPQWFITIIFIITMVYFLSKGPNVMFRASLALFYISAILYIISILSLSGQVRIDNIKPILQRGIIPVLKGIYNYISYMILPIFMILIIPKGKIEDRKLNKNIIITYFITNIFIFAIMFTLVGVFGIELTKLYQYPAYHALKRVFIGGFIERMENTLSIQWIINLFIPCAFSYYYIISSIKQISNIKKNIIIYPIIIAIMYSSLYIFKNNTISEDMLQRFYPLIMGIFFIIIPVIICIRIWYKKKIQKVSL